MCVDSEWCCRWSHAVWHRNKFYSRTQKLLKKNKRKLLSLNSKVQLWVPDGDILTLSTVTKLSGIDESYSKYKDFGASEDKGMILMQREVN